MFLNEKLHIVFDTGKRLLLLKRIINYIDNLIGIPLDNRELFILNILISGFFILMIVFYKFKQHESRTSK